MKTETTTLTVTRPWDWHVGDMAKIAGGLRPTTNGAWIVTKVTGFELTLRPPTILERIWFWLLRVTWKPRARFLVWRELRRARGVK